MDLLNLSLVYEFAIVMVELLKSVDPFVSHPTSVVYQAVYTGQHVCLCCLCMVWSSNWCIVHYAILNWIITITLKGIISLKHNQIWERAHWLSEKQVLYSKARNKNVWCVWELRMVVLIKIKRICTWYENADLKKILSLEK